MTGSMVAAARPYGVSLILSQSCELMSKREGE
jgi:hypothetical protein